MIVCSCNAIRDTDVRRAARAGAPCAMSAYRFLGHDFQCGGCEDHADEIVADERAALLATDAKAA